MKKLLSLAVFCLCALFVNAQDFNSAVGLRLGYPASITYKKFISETNAIEAYVGLRPLSGGSWFAANAAYLIHADLEIEDVEGIQWYYGFGAGVQRVGFSSSLLENSIFLGLSGYLGLSYTFDDLPINVSVDWVPTIFVGGYDGLGAFGGGYGALAVRYVLDPE